MTTTPWFHDPPIDPQKRTLWLTDKYLQTGELSYLKELLQRYRTSPADMDDRKFVKRPAKLKPGQHKITPAQWAILKQTGFYDQQSNSDGSDDS